MGRSAYLLENFVLDTGGPAVVPLSRKGENIRNLTLVSEAGGPGFGLALARLWPKGKNIKNLILISEAGGPAVVPLSQREKMIPTIGPQTAVLLF